MCVLYLVSMTKAPGGLVCIVDMVNRVSGEPERILWILSMNINLLSPSKTTCHWKQTILCLYLQVYFHLNMLAENIKTSST